LCYTAAEHGGGIEIAWVVDDRNQANVNLTNMAGVQDSLIIARTEAGRQGTAGAWPSNRGVRGLITQVNTFVVVRCQQPNLPVLQHALPEGVLHVEL
jgi:hypothetical protein